MREFLERLPGPADWTFMVGAIVVGSGCYRPFMRECRAAGPPTSPSVSASDSPRQQGVGVRHRRSPLACSGHRGCAHERARGWKKIALRYRAAAITLYLYCLIKYRLVELISQSGPSSPLGDLRYLDCFVPGRFRFVGRSNLIAGQLVSVFFLWFLNFRLLIHNHSARKFKFHALEFLMTSRAEVLASQADTVGEFSASAHNAHRPTTQVNSVSYLRSPFAPHANKWYLRPNRTLESWRALRLAAKVCFYYSIQVLIFGLSSTLFGLSGLLITDLGFELSYPACLAWLRDVQTTAGSDNFTSIYIYRAPAVLAREFPIDEIPARVPSDFPRSANLYALARISLDVLENVVVFAEYLIVFLTQVFMLAIQAVDVSLNATRIRRRLLALLERLEQVRLQHAPLAGSAAASERHYEAWWASRRPVDLPGFESENQLSREIEQMQAILADHFENIVQGYNTYTSYVVVNTALCWLHYTVVECNWIYTTRSRAIELEFLVAESSVTIFSLLLMSGAALVRSQNLKLYALIARAMALDRDWSTSKPRWSTLLRYFHPRPLFCFSLLGRSEISWLLGLKLLSWILSAFVVLASFYYVGQV